MGAANVLGLSLPSIERASVAKHPKHHRPTWTHGAPHWKSAANPWSRAGRIGDQNTSTGRPFGAALDPTKSYYSSIVQPLDVLTNFHPEMCLYVCLHLHVWFICLSWYIYIYMYIYIYIYICTVNIQPFFVCCHATLIQCIFLQATWPFHVERWLAVRSPASGLGSSRRWAGVVILS